VIERQNDATRTPADPEATVMPVPPRSSGPELPIVALPPKIPLQIWRPAQSNIPNERAQRDLLKREAEALCRERDVVPPLAMGELRTMGEEVVRRAGLDPVYREFAAVLVSNAAWRDIVAQVPYERRLLLMPKCLRVEEKCPAPFDEFGLLCKECGLCSIQDLGKEAERLGYAVLVAEGSAIVRAMIDTGKIEAIVGVSCLNVLEKSFPHMEAGAIPGGAIPLLQDDCVNTNVDMDQVWDVIHLTSDDKTYRLDLDGVKREVESWFTPESLEHLMGPARGHAERVGRDWLARDGKRWRPYLTACVSLAHEVHEADEAPEFSDDLKKVCLAVECFHKASLVHDDIEDADDERYGVEALHVEHGVPVALNVGDFLVGEGYRLLAETGLDGETRARMLGEAARGHVTLARGQGEELSWTRDPRPLSSMDVLSIFREKTAPAFEVALRLGALHAGADDEVHEALSAYSESLGIAYQIRDDLDDHGSAGAGDSDDLAGGRPSLILSIAHKRAEGEDKEVVEALWRRTRTYSDVRAELDRILEAKGVLDKTRELRDAYQEQAINSLRVLRNATLKGLLRRVIGKIFGDEHLIEGYCSEFEARNAPGVPAGQAPAR